MLKQIPALLLVFTTLLSCQSSRPSISQGLTGYIYELKGNQMPAIGRPVSKGKGVAREILIYRPAKAADAVGKSPFFIAVNTKLVATIKSDATGHYTIQLPPGQYSVFIKNDDHLFASETDNGGYINWVEVKKDLVTNKDFRLTGEAAF